tara:strand:- start:157 stop:1419 length:1263 start_codon:yes stop_codon:yes gene_type:complete
MADVKFSELSSMTASDVASADILAVVDSSESASKQLTIDNLFGEVPVNISVADLTQSTSNTTGSITTSGGLGVVKDTFLGGSLDVDGTTNLDAVDIDGNVQLDGTLTIGVDDTGYDVKLFGATASSNMLWDESDNALEFGNSTITMSDARTSGTATITGLTIDISNKLDTGSSNDRIGIDCDVIGDVNGYTIRDAVAIRAVSRQSTGAEVTRLNTPIHAVLDLANTTSANNTGTTLSGAYGLVIDHDDTIATRTGQPTAFISFGELYVGGTESIETKYLFDIFPEGKTGDATYGTGSSLSFFTDNTCYASAHDNITLDSTDGAPGTDENDYIILEPDPFDAIILESGTTSGEGGDDIGFINTESGESIVLEDSSQDNPTGYGGRIQYEKGSQDADGVLKIRVNGQDKYIQLYNSPGSAVY